MKLLPVVLLSVALGCAQSKIEFTPHQLADGLKGGYQVVIADLNHDGRPDIIALASGMPDLIWFENPGPGSAPWERHVLASGLPHMINCAAGNPDGEGIPEIVIAWEFASDAAKSIGKVGVLHHDGDPRQPWKLHQIDELATSHRIRWADLDGSGHPVAVNAPLTGASAKPPLYAGHTPLVFYRPGEWKRELIGEGNEGVQHGIFIIRWNKSDTRDSILTASFSGIDLYRHQSGKWVRTELAPGDPSACPKCGSSDIAVGHSGNDRFIAAIEPWHGNQVAVYREKGAKWQREQLDDSLVDGHTIVTADFDGDGRDELVAGFRQGEKAVYLYQTNLKGWDKQVVDHGIGAAACAAADLNGDGRVDLACIGGSAVKWYENVTAGAKTRAFAR